MSDNTSFGHKAENLFLLQEKGFHVPPFRIMSADQVREIVLHPESLETILQDILGDFAPEFFAVRSSTSTEDGTTHSNAGQYHTEIAVLAEDLHEAILKTIELSRAKLFSDESLSLVIQEYVEPDISGVCFTRDPNGGREYILEYHTGRGLDLVGGEIVPHTIRGYWTDTLFSEIGGLDMRVFLEIEGLFETPQDVEWCIRDNILFILQSRPITTIPHESYRSILFLELHLLNQEGDYCYEKTGVTEVAPRPIPFTRSLLERIYAQGGPIDRAYREQGIMYIARDFLKIFGADLYVDREAELQTLLPAYSLLNKEYKPKLASWKGLWITLRNLVRLTRGFDRIGYGEQIFERLSKNPEPKNLQETLDQFLDDYQRIFLVNLSAANTLERLKSLLGKEKSRLADILTLGLVREKSLLDLLPIGSTEGLIGNSLDIADESPFTSSLDRKAEPSAFARQWFATVPKWKQRILQKSIDDAVLADQFRECGRILMVRNLSKIREFLLDTAKNHGFGNPRDIYSLTIDECLGSAFSESVAKERKEIFETYQSFILPSSITRHYRAVEQVHLGVSSGKVTGILVDMHSIESSPRPRILFTESLSPDLYQYFDQIDGIISSNGGLLSHLSILARESGFPVVIASGGQKFIFGEEYSIDGGSGEIEKVIQSRGE